MRFSYYPGCSLRTKAKNLDDSTKAVATVLGVELDELPGWVCCGAVPPLVTDNIMNLLAPVRNLASAEKRGDRLVTTCAFCYNILKRSNTIVKEDAEKRDKINSFIEENYTGNIRVLHLLEVLRDEIGFEAIKGRIRFRLKELTVAPYYGCLLLRPYEIIRLDKIKEKKNKITIEIQIIAINRTILVGIPGEMFVELGLEIKKKSRFKHTFIVGLANDYVGYIPTKTAFGEGGYTIRTARWSKLIPEAGPLIVSRTLDLINKIYKSGMQDED